MQRTAILFFIFLFAQNTFGQTNYFVGTSGQDASGYGTTTATPFKTITYAANYIVAGDTINVLGGTYHNPNFGNGSFWNSDEAVYLNNLNGNTSGYITIRPYQNQSVIFNGNGNYIFQIRNSSFIRIEGFEIAGEVNNIPLDSALKYQFMYKDAGGNIQYRVPPFTPDSIVDTMTFAVLNNITRPAYFSTIGLLVQGSNHIDVINNHIHHTPGTGLRAFQSDYIKFIANEVNDCSRRSSIGNHGFVVENSASIDNSDADKIFIEQNKIHHNYNEVYSWSETKTFNTPIIDEGKGISMQKNTIQGGWVHGRIKIDNNICFLNGFSGIHSNQGVRMEIINNTCYLNSYTGSGNNIGISLQGSDSISIYNNIVVADTTWNGFAISSTDTAHIKVSNNLVQGHLDTDINTIDANTVFSTPQFVNASTFNFYLQSTSAAINAALTSVAPQVDFYNITRDNLPDIGAVEFFVQIGITNVSVTNNILVYPNPFSYQTTISFSEEQTNSTIRIIDVLGNEIQKINFTRKECNIDKGELKSGIYFVNITNNKGNITTTKIILQ